MIVGYGRIFAIEPASRLRRQREELASIGADVFFFDRASVFGPTPELEKAISAVKKGDVIAITKPYRAGRTSKDIVRLIERLSRKGVGFRILDTPVDTSTTTGRMILGSTPLWSLGISPVQAILIDLGRGLRIGRRRRSASDLQAPFGRQHGQH